MPKLEKIEGDLYVRPDTGRIYLRIYTDWLGEKYRSTGQTELRAAKRIATRIREEVEAVAEECFRVKIEGKKRRARTVQSARHIYDLLIDAFGPLDIEDVTDDKWLEQLDRWEEERGRTAFRQIRVYANQIDRYAVAKGYKRGRLELPVEDPDPREGVVIEPEEFERLVEATGKLYRVKERFYLKLILHMGYYMGMRRNEMLGLTWDRVDYLKSRTFLLKAEHVKTGSRKRGRRRRRGRGRHIGIAPQVEPLLPVAREMTPSQWVLPNRTHTGPMTPPKTSLETIRKVTGIDFTLHDLRHTFLTRKLLREKKNPMDVAIYAGVSLETIQDVYLHPTVEDTRGVVE